jgi:hypothetical protein
MNLWMDHVPEEWFEFRHTIKSHPFCTECDLYGEKQWFLEDEYRCVLINAPFAYNMGDRWIWICLECFHGETEDEHFYELDIISEEDYQMDIDNKLQNPYDMG